MLKREVSSSKLLQEKLSHYLDMVEIAIVRQISLRSDAFFKAMSSHDQLHVSLRNRYVRIVETVMMCKQLFNNLVISSLF